MHGRAEKKIVQSTNMANDTRNVHCQSLGKAPLYFFHLFDILIT